MKLELLYHPNELLATTCEEWNVENPPMDPLELKTVLFEHMKKFSGIGLSANQVGLPYRVFALQNNSTNNIREREMLAINPAVDEVLGDDVEMWESCLSIPDIMLNVKRPHKIKASWTNEKGVRRTETLAGYTARVFLHELDHLNGISMNERVSPIEWKEAVATAEAKKKKHA